MTPYRTGYIQISTDRFGRYTYASTVNGRTFAEQCRMGTPISQVIQWGEDWVDRALS